MTNRADPGTQDGEGGSALAFVLIIMAAMLFVVAISMHVGLGSRRSSLQSQVGKNAFFCAEQALELGRVVFGQNKWEWDAAISGIPATPAWYPITGNCTGPGNYTFQVTARDDMDEAPPMADDPNADQNMSVYVDADAMRGGVVRARVTALIRNNVSMMGDYEHQEGLGGAKTRNKQD